MENFGKKSSHVENSRVREYLPFCFPYAPPFEAELPPFPTCLLIKGYLWLLQPFNGNKPARETKETNGLR